MTSSFWAKYYRQFLLLHRQNEISADICSSKVSLYVAHSIVRAIRYLYLLFQALSALPSSKWAEQAGREAFGVADTLEQLLRLQAAFAKARRLLREMGEVRVIICIRNTTMMPMCT